jgi:hypothetical protein
MVVERSKTRAKAKPQNKAQKKVEPQSRDSGGISRLFGDVANKTSQAAGRAVVIVWAVTGPLFRYSDTWQPVINTGTTIVTFLMVFLIQNSQNREKDQIIVWNQIRGCSLFWHLTHIALRLGERNDRYCCYSTGSR